MKLSQTATILDIKIAKYHNISVHRIHQNRVQYIHYVDSERRIVNMAEGGIDRKADERMEFTTSKEVTVAPTFEASLYTLDQHASGDANKL